MPKRGTEYELFVKEVYGYLNRADGLSDVQIQHDVKLIGAAGVEHQIDVFWTFKIGEVNYRVAVECKDYNIHVSKEKVEAFHAILIDVGNIYGIFVSKMGFQRGAAKYAQKYGIQLMEIRKPIDDDWKGRIKDIYLDLSMPVIENLKARIFVNNKRIEEQGIKVSEDSNKYRITNHELIEFSAMIVDKKIVENVGKTSISELTKNLPQNKPGKDNKIIYVFKNGIINLENLKLPLDGIEFIYDVCEVKEKITIYGEDSIMAIVKNITDGSEKHIDRFGRVSSRIKT